MKSKKPGPRLRLNKNMQDKILHLLMTRLSREYACKNCGITVRTLDRWVLTGKKIAEEKNKRLLTKSEQLFYDFSVTIKRVTLFRRYKMLSKNQHNVLILRYGTDYKNIIKYNDYTEFRRASITRVSKTLGMSPTQMCNTQRRAIRKITNKKTGGTIC